MRPGRLASVLCVWRTRIQEPWLVWDQKIVAKEACQDCEEPSYPYLARFRRTRLLAFSVTTSQPSSPSLLIWATWPEHPRPQPTIWYSHFWGLWAAVARE